jgi:hypothetical protein
MLRGLPADPSSSGLRFSVQCRHSVGEELGEDGDGLWGDAVFLADNGLAQRVGKNLGDPNYRRPGHPSNLPRTRRTRPEVVLSPRFCRSIALQGSAWTLAYIGTSA